MQHEHKLFSVVIATYNRRSTLERSLQSILNQTYQRFEIIVVDDGSTDGTHRLFEDHYTDLRITYKRFSENKGATIARNHGIAAASGDCIMVWDSDDELLPFALETLATLFDQYPEAAVVSAPAIQLQDGIEIPYRIALPGFMSLSDVVCKKLPNNEKVRAAKKEVWNGVRYVSKNLDFMVNGYLAQKGAWYHHDKALGVLHIERSDSLTKARRKANKKISIERAYHLEMYLKEFGDVLKDSCKHRYAALCYGAALGFLLDDKREQARHWGKEAYRYDRKNIRNMLISISTVIPGGMSLVKILFTIREMVRL